MVAFMKIRRAAERKIQNGNNSHNQCNSLWAYLMYALGMAETVMILLAMRLEDNSSRKLEQITPPWINLSQQHRPTLILYVGLPKTGTTFLQCILCSNATHTAPILRKDNFVYLGTCMWKICGMTSHNPDFLEHRQHNFFEAGQQYSEIGGNPLGPSLHPGNRTLPSTLPKVAFPLHDKLHKARQNGSNALIIYEGLHRFSQKHIAALAQYLERDWDTRVIVAYRRLFEWLPSKYNSYYKNNRHGPWPDKAGGVRVESFDLQDRGTFSDFVQYIEQVHQHPAEMVLRNYRRYFGNVQLLDLHHLETISSGARNEYLEHFMCHVLPRADFTCEAAKANRLGQAASNPSEPFDYDILAVAAYEAGLVNPQRERSYVWEYIRRHQEEELHLTHRDFPLECLPNTTLNRLLDLSLTLERQLFANKWSLAHEKEHRESFSTWVENKKYCSVDVKRVLADEKWQDFFKTMR